MSETVKLIIEISKSAYEEMSKHGTDRVDYDIQQMINNGKPLPKVLDEIKAEIETDLSWEMFDEYGNETALHEELWEIFDNIGKGDTEE